MNANHFINIPFYILHMYPTLSDYLEKARRDYKRKINSPNNEYLEFQRRESKLKKFIKNKFKVG